MTGTDASALDRRRTYSWLLIGFARLELQPAPPELASLRRWLGSWTGTGAVITGMLRQKSDHASGFGYRKNTAVDQPV